MKTVLYIFAILFFVFQSCEAKKKELTDKLQIKENRDTLIANYRRKYDPKTGFETYDLELVKKLGKKMLTPFVKTRDGCTTLKPSMLCQPSRLRPERRYHRAM